MRRAARWSCAAVAVVVLLGPRAAGAADKPPRVAVGKVSGSISFMVQSSLETALRKRSEIVLVPASELDGAEDAGDDPAALARVHGIQAFVEADAARAGKSWQATVRVVSGADQQVLETWKVKSKEIKKLTAAIEAGLWKALGPAILRAPPVARAKPVISRFDDEPKAPVKSDAAGVVPAPATKEGEAEAPAVEPGSPRSASTRALELIAGLDVFARSLRYNDDLFGRLRPYTLSGAPAVGLRATWFPGAHFTGGIAASFGLQLGLQYGFGIESSDSSGARFPTSALELSGALAGRIPLGESHALTIVAGAGVQEFTVDAADGGVFPDVPKVGYGFLRFGTELHLRLIEALSLRAGAGFRYVLSAGDIQDDQWFPRSDALGLDGAVSIGYAVAEPLELLLGVSGRHYFYSMNPEPGDPRIAGGAVDQYFGGTLAVAFSL